MTALTLNLESITQLTHEQFRKLCWANPDLKLERTATGDLIVMPPTGWESGRRNANLNADLVIWNRQTKLGSMFDSSTGFILPNGAVRSPDAAWVRSERLTALTLNPEPEGFLPLAPDFVVELRSASDRLKPLQDKMHEYCDNGVFLGWLLNVQDSEAEIYRLGQAVEVMQSPVSLCGEDILPGFILNLQEIFS
jgi:Uma2 family endonuclease